jgi:outer membrane immunogenic protein
MRRHLVVLCTTAALGFGFSQVAVAADMPVKASVRKAPAVLAAIPFWTGFYAGASLGARWTNNGWTSSDLFPNFAPTVQTAGTGGPMDSVAARVAGYMGYNWQIAPLWIAGIEADIGWANNNRTANPLPGTPNATFPLALPTGSVKETWDASLRGRLGYLVTPDTLLYGSGGVALQRVELNASCIGGNGGAFCAISRNETYGTTKFGWTIGAGVERKLWGNWLARIDYRYADFGTFNQLFFAPAGVGFDDRFTAHVKVQTHTVTVGLAYQF